MARIEDRIQAQEDQSPDHCPNCNGGLLVREIYPHGVFYPEAQPCSACGNRQPDGCIQFMEIDLTGRNIRQRPDSDAEEDE